MTIAMELDEILSRQAVIPVLTISREEDAAPLATCLVEAGLPVLEVTLRTPAALEAIRRMSRIPGAIIGAGTVLSASDAEVAVMAGARFLVAPGLSNRTIAAAQKMRTPILPGIATPTELMAGYDLGLRRFKFFPAEQAGGRPMLEALHGPFAEARFCPTGGITLDSAPEYLKLPNVICVGGGWIAPKSIIEAHGWDEIRTNAQKAAMLWHHA